jgi:hypothetical protein
MKILRYSFSILVFCFLTLSVNEPLYSWGFFAHKRINRLAVFTLPPEMIGFYKRNIEFVTEHAVDPDKRRYANPEEAPRHYIDIDHYSAEKNPFAVMPRKWDDAVTKFTEDTLKAYGTVPWHINSVVHWLTKAFREGNLDDILRLSADLGHYIGDSHVPLHNTENYNGQLTGQRGIHGFWESTIPELKAEDYDLFTGRAQYVKSPLDLAWNTCEVSFAAKDSVLDFEKELSKKFPEDRKYAFQQRGASTVKTYSDEFTIAYNELLNGMVERRMRASIITVGSLWYTAWVDAGQPDLSKFYDKEVSQQMKEQLAEEELEQKSNDKAHGRDCGH